MADCRHFKNRNHVIIPLPRMIRFGANSVTRRKDLIYKKISRRT